MMKFLWPFLLCSLPVFGNVTSVSEPLPTEGSVVVPEWIKPETSSIEEVVEEAKPLPQRAKKEEKTSLTSSEARENSTGTILVGYQPMTSWLPSKKTVSYTHIFNEKWSLEAEFSFASLNAPFIGVDLGRIRERRYTLQARRYAGNSFHLSFGAAYSTFTARLGSDILDSLGNEINSDFSADNIGMTGGIGNRWQWENGLTLGIDWIRLNVPVYESRVEDNVLGKVSSKGDREDIKDVIRTFNRLPTFVLFGINAGYTF